MNKSFWLDVMMNATNEAIVIVDENGIIIALSAAYTEFLNIKPNDAIGKHVTEVIENTRMHHVLETKKAEYAAPQAIQGQYMVATRIPIFKDGKVVGAFGRVLFKNIKELFELNDKILEMESQISLYKSKWGGINEAKYTTEDIIGQSHAIRFLRDTIKLVAVRNSNILITGESGTGKELVAHAIHSASYRRRNPMICVNCAAIPSELIESELFGYVEGAFTGAKKGGKAGLFKAANGGTLFLDEIGDLSFSVQVKLLRALQDREIRKVGSSVGEPVDVRIVAATNKNLLQMIEDNQFRADLYYRLNVISIDIPPIRERREDIPVLVDHFVKKIIEREHMPDLSVSQGAMEQLKSYDWPGNIRELENTLERASNFVEADGIVKLHHLKPRVLENMANSDRIQLKEVVEAAERSAIIRVISKHKGNKSKAAQELGITRTSLYEKMDRLGIKNNLFS